MNYLLRMEKAIEKILNNFVIGNIDISYYEIESHLLPADNMKVYVADIYVPLSISTVDAEALLDRLKTAFNLLGFTRVKGNIFHDADVEKLLIRVRGYIKKD